MVDFEGSKNKSLNWITSYFHNTVKISPAHMKTSQCYLHFQGTEAWECEPLENEAGNG